MPPTAKPANTRALAPRPTGLEIKTVQDLMAFAEIVYRAGHKGFNKPEQVAYAMAFGMQLGLHPAIAPTLINVAQGKPSAEGEAALSLIKSSPLCEKLDHGVDGEGDARKGWITTKRVGELTERTTTFSVADAKRAGYWEAAHMKGQGPWKTHPDRMLKWRAIGHHAKDWWADVMCGLAVVDDDRPIEAEVVGIKPASTATPAASPIPTTAPGASEPPALTDKPTTLPTPTDTDPAGPITEYQKSKFAAHRLDFLKSRGVSLDNEASVRATWVEFLSRWGVKSATQMTRGQADEALAIIYEAVHTPEQRAMFEQGNANGQPTTTPSTATAGLTSSSN